MKTFKIGEKVFWVWMGKNIEGQVVEIHKNRIEKMIKGKKIVRNGTSDMPAYLVVSTAGNQALKLHSELNKIEKVTKSGSKPKMFS